MTHTDIRNFKEGLGRITISKPQGYSRIYGFINKKGIKIIKAQFEDATDFNNGYFIVKTVGKEDGISVLDKLGKSKLDLPGMKFFSQLEVSKEEFVFSEKTQGKKGLWNIQGKKNHTCVI